MLIGSVSYVAGFGIGTVIQHNFVFLGTEGRLQALSKLHTRILFRLSYELISRNCRKKYKKI